MKRTVSEGEGGGRKDGILGGNDEAAVGPHQAIRLALLGAGPYAREIVVPILLQLPAFHLKAVWSRTERSAAYLNSLSAGGSLETYWGGHFFRNELTPEKQPYQQCHQEEGKNGGSGSGGGGGKEESGGGGEGASGMGSSDNTSRGLEDLLRRADIDGVVIALPGLVTPSFVLRVLRAGKHVYSSGPIALDEKTGASLMQMYHAKFAAKLTWSVGMDIRYESAFTKVRMMLPDLGDVLGAQLLAVRAVGAGDHATLAHLRKQANQPGGLLREMLMPYVGIMRKILGDVACVAAFPSRHNELFSTYDTLDGVIYFESGTSATVSVSLASQGPSFLLTVTGTNGKFVVKNNTMQGGYTVQRCLQHFEHPMLHPTSGTAFAIQAWGEAVRHEQPDVWNTPVQALHDLSVSMTLAQSKGMPIRFREKGPN
ncbi:unnamed protein product [Vitrella brassicaformis CCMP3155]|uniref:GFO/IDH/MocA-like oxidoreductase domain-containing protein n=1 Tax=Vitrella brassicaformis (strain CCMP3155) TaxID=1169540 RepID=A0A0G4EYR3_VITBC|nr:unnamed protein product [Vitrella brassicaformis CCMP3155]|mmetsp:Transcript_36681/g.105103  ORF Transcript_36681/g.105103 Transcript_36681/m.105103 type:complete len:426 (+) Transcript_36681:80-1357(+)|eukprot:CEM04301.1 unnamed protein product [Vitrella brassicaformis CCMP3155]